MHMSFAHEFLYMSSSMEGVLKVNPVAALHAVSMYRFMYKLHGA